MKGKFKLHLGQFSKHYLTQNNFNTIAELFWHIIFKGSPSDIVATIYIVYLGQ